MTGEFPDGPGSEAFGLGKRRIAHLPDIAPDIARWPEWGVERWEEAERAPVPSFAPVLDRCEQERPQEVPNCEPLAGAAAAAHAVAPHGAERTEEKSGNNIAKLALGIMAGLLFFAGDRPWADAPSPRPVATERPVQLSGMGAQPSNQSAITPSAFAANAGISQTLPNDRPMPLTLPTNGSKGEPPALPLDAAEVTTDPPITPPKTAPQFQHPAHAGPKQPTRSDAALHHDSPGTSRRLSRSVVTRECVYPMHLGTGCVAPGFEARAQ